MKACFCVSCLNRAELLGADDVPGLPALARPAGAALLDALRAERGPVAGRLAVRLSAGGGGSPLDDGMDLIDLIDGMDGSAREEGFSFMLGAAVPTPCSLSLTVGRSLMRTVRGGTSAGAAVVRGVGGSAGAAAVCGGVPFTWAAFSLGVGPGRWQGLAALSFCG